MLPLAVVGPNSNVLSQHPTGLGGYTFYSVTVDPRVPTNVVSYRTCKTSGRGGGGGDKSVCS